MNRPTQTGRRVVALVLAVILILGGVGGISRYSDQPLAIVGAAVAIVVGLLFLRRAASR